MNVNQSSPQHKCLPDLNIMGLVWLLSADRNHWQFDFVIAAKTSTNQLLEFSYTNKC